MYCQYCGKDRRPNSKFCPHCGEKQITKQRIRPITIIFIFILLVSSIITTVFVVTSILTPSNTVVSEETASAVQQHTSEEVPDEEPEEDEITSPASEKQELEAEQKRELTEIIAVAQETVYTVFTPYSQGSGFLYNTDGAVVTNAHVVEGETEVYIKTIHGIEYPGTVIGFSNETDVAVIHVPALQGVQPFEIETSDTTMIGEEIIALGSPLGLENTATMGYITGKNRNFIIDPYVYENLYQISAPISPGSSGGPLISKSTEKIIAINSAESIEDASIGFSIPLYTVHSLIESWIHQPMNEDEILALYYDIGDIYTWSDGYFDGGEYSEEEDYYYYWEYGYEDFWQDFGDALWEYFEDENSYYDEWYSEESYFNDEEITEEGNYDTYEEENIEEPYNNSFPEEQVETDEGMFYDEETGVWSYYDEIDDQWYYYDNYLETWTYFNEQEQLWYYYDEELGKYVPY